VGGKRKNLRKRNLTMKRVKSLDVLSKGINLGNRKVRTGREETGNKLRLISKLHELLHFK
jgi:hypothetical protein